MSRRNAWRRVATIRSAYRGLHRNIQITSQMAPSVIINAVVLCLWLQGIRLCGQREGATESKERTFENHKTLRILRDVGLYKSHAYEQGREIKLLYTCMSQ